MENLTCFSDLYGARGTNPDALLERLGLGAHKNKFAGEYSKGMKQRVMLIAALLHNPDVLILDEPDSGLDISTTLVLRQLMIALAGRGKAVLYSSHVLDLVEKACSRVMVIHHGRIVADESVDVLRGRGVEFQDTPDTYYEMLPERIQGHGEDIKELEKRRILMDGAPTEGQGLLLQIFTQNVIGPIFFELIQRKGNEGFGEGNFKALFESIELDQIRRGVI